jgi:hypothetical protein
MKNAVFWDDTRATRRNIPEDVFFKNVGQKSCKNKRGGDWAGLDWLTQGPVEGKDLQILKIVTNFLNT